MLTEIILIIFAIMSIIFSFMVALFHMGRNFKFSVLFLYILGSIIFINIGYISYYMEYSTQEWAITAILSVSFGLIFVSIGGLLTTIILNSRKKWSNSIKKEVIIDIPYTIAFITAVIIFGIVLLYFYLLGYIPLIEGIKNLLTNGFHSGLVNTLRVNRDVYVNSKASYIPLQGLFEEIRYFGIPIISIWFLHFYRLGIHKKISIFMLIISAFLITLTGQRWPLMYLLLTLIIYFSWTTIHIKEFKKALYKIGLLAIICGIILSALLGRTNRSNLSVFQMVIFGISDLYSRIFLGNVRIPFLSYQIFNSSSNLLYGWSWIQDLISYLPGPYPSYPVTFYKLVTGDIRGFTAPPDFYTEAFINFGWIGLIFICFFWGSLLSILQYKLEHSHLSLKWISVYSLIMTLIAFSAMSGIVFMLGGLIVSIFIILLMKFESLILLTHPNKLNKFEQFHVSNM